MNSSEKFTLRNIWMLWRWVLISMCIDWGFGSNFMIQIKLISSIGNLCGGATYRTSEIEQTGFLIFWFNKFLLFIPSNLAIETENTLDYLDNLSWTFEPKHTWTCWIWNITTYDIFTSNATQFGKLITYMVITRQTLIVTKPRVYVLPGVIVV